MNPTSTFRLQATLAFAAVYLVWGSTYLAIRVALETLPAFTMAGFRFLAAGSVMLLWAVIRRSSWPRWQELRSTLLLGFLFLFCGNGAVVWAEYQVPSGLAALLVGTEPLFVGLLLLFWPREDRPGKVTLFAFVLGFVGTALLATGGGEIGGALHLPSVLLILLACLSWAVASLYSRRAPLPSSPILSAALQMLSGGFYLFVFGRLLGEPLAIPWQDGSQRSFMAWGYLAVFGSIVAFGAFTWLVRNVRPTMVATYAYVNPIVAVILGWLLAGEPFGGRSLVAAIFILGAVLLAATDRPRKKWKKRPGAAFPALALSQPTLAEATILAVTDPGKGDASMTVEEIEACCA
jgi:drug/metabolite transporter (DMT)-like permease